MEDMTEAMDDDQPEDQRKGSEAWLERVKASLLHLVALRDQALTGLTP